MNSLHQLDPRTFPFFCSLVLRPTDFGLNSWKLGRRCANSSYHRDAIFEAPPSPATQASSRGPSFALNRLTDDPSGLRGRRRQPRVAMEGLICVLVCSSIGGSTRKFSHTIKVSQRSKLHDLSLPSCSTFSCSRKLQV